jgi:hypothetical protein
MRRRADPPPRRLVRGAPRASAWSSVGGRRSSPAASTGGGHGRRTPANPVVAEHQATEQQHDDEKRWSRAAALPGDGDEVAAARRKLAAGPSSHRAPSPGSTRQRMCRPLQPTADAASQGLPSSEPSKTVHGVGSTPSPRCSWIWRGCTNGTDAGVRLHGRGGGPPARPLGSARGVGRSRVPARARRRLRSWPPDHTRRPAGGGSSASAGRRSVAATSSKI